jgi:cell division initiation protein
MITPADIQKKEFTKGVRGYKEDEVDSFLDLLTLDLDKLISENAALKDNVRALNLEIERYRSSEGTIFDTLESAKALMADISASAEKRAEIVLKNAELDAERMLREARESVESLTEEAVEMARRWEQFKTRYHNLLQNELDRFETLSRDFMSDADAHRARFYSDTLPGARGNGADGGGAEPAAAAASASVAADPVADLADSEDFGGDFEEGKTIVTAPKRSGR